MLPAVNPFAYFEGKSRAGTLDIHLQDGRPRVWLSEGAARQHGVSADDVPLEFADWLERLSPESRQRLESLWLSPEENREFAGELEIRLADGSVARLHLLAEKRLEADGPRICGLFLESEPALTVLQSPDDSLLLNDQRYRQAMEALGMVFWD